MISLNYSNPLFSADTSHTSFTATKECYLLACVLGTLKLNDVDITSILTINNRWYGSVNLPLIKLRSGDNISISANYNGTKVNVYEPL